MEQDNLDAESTRDLRLSRWWIPALAALMAVNLCLVALAVQPRDSAELALPLPEGPSVPVLDSQQKAAPVGPQQLPSESDMLPVQPAPAQSAAVSAAPAPDPVALPGAASGQPPIVAEAEPATTSQPQPPALVIANPPLSGGPVHYALDGEVFTLQPGQYQRLAVSGPRRIEFDRGDEFGYTQQELVEGTFLFEVGAAGWSLEMAELDQAQRIIEACRPIE